MRVINCVCGERIEVPDGGDVAVAMKAHSDRAHPELKFSEDQLRAMMRAHDARVASWDGSTRRIDGPLQVRPLTPERANDFLAFFDRDAFADNPAWSRCYCYIYNAPHGVDWNTRTPEQNRADKERSILRGESRGLLAYYDGRVIGWCHAAPRASLPGLGDFNDDPDDATVGSIVCFNIAPPYRGQGVAGQLLAAACESLRADGLTFAEAYPPREAPSAARAYHGTVRMYEAAGFAPHRELGRYVVMRKAL